MEDGMTAEELDKYYDLELLYSDDPDLQILFEAQDAIELGRPGFTS